MINLLEDVHKALDARAFYLALTGALVLPDICGSMEYADGVANRNRYAAWFDEWIGPRYEAFLSGKQCYEFRCDLLHQATTGSNRRSYKKILFLVPGATTATMHKNILMGALNLDLNAFCGDMTSGAYRWLQARSETQPVKGHLSRLIRAHPQGIAPYIVCLPVIG
jgi:hypothetical protein